MKNMRIGVMITTVANRKEILIKNLQRLAKFMPAPFAVYIYNDAGPKLTDEIKAAIPGSADEAMTIQICNDQGEINKNHVGCGGGRNFLFDLMKREYDVIVSLDDDMLITEGWFEAIIEGIEAHPNHSIFTGVVTNQYGNIQIAGSNMCFSGNTLVRKENRRISETYCTTDWGPLGCLVLCREALQEDVAIPNLFVREDSAFFLLCKEIGINETIVCKNAVAIHKAGSVPGSNLRRKEKLEEATEYFKEHYGLDM